MKIKRIFAVVMSVCLMASMLVFTADAVATQGNPRIWVFRDDTGFGATDPQNSALKNQYDAENDIIYTRVIPNNYSAAGLPYLAQWNVKCVFDGTEKWSLTVACLMRPNVAGVTPVLCSAQSRTDTAGTVNYNGEEKYTPATDADGNEIVFDEDDIGKWHTVYFRHDGLTMRYYNQYQILPYGRTGKASDYYTADNSKTVDIAVLAEFATDAEALAADLEARAEAPKITLTFDKGNGEEATTAEVVTGAYLPAKVDFPEITAPEGMAFLGWATDKNAVEGALDIDVPTENTAYYAIYEEIVPEEVDTTFKVAFAREGAPLAGNYAKLAIYTDSTKSELAFECTLENANTAGAEASVDVTLLEGTYYAEVVKNGYLPYSSELTVSKIAPTLKIELIPGDIKGSLDAVCGDGEINLDDFIRALRGFAQETPSNVKNAVDINEDGVVNVIDIGFVKTNFGKRAN